MFAIREGTGDDPPSPTFHHDFGFVVVASTAVVSSPLLSSPKFLICPTFGVFSLGLIASALRYACCSAFALAA